MDFRVVMPASGVTGEEVGQEEIVGRLRSGEALKFITAIYVNINLEKLIMLLALGDTEHSHIIEGAHDLMENARGQRCWRVDMPPMGGGLIKIENDTLDDVLIFFGRSQKFGSFDPDMLRKIDEPDQLRKFFGVSRISFEGGVSI